jgi:hypothetical protein
MLLATQGPTARRRPMRPSPTRVRPTLLPSTQQRACDPMPRQPATPDVQRLFRGRLVLERHDAAVERSRRHLGRGRERRVGCRRRRYDPSLERRHLVAERERHDHCSRRTTWNRLLQIWEQSGSKVASRFRNASWPKSRSVLSASGCGASPRPVADGCACSRRIAGNLAPPRRHGASARRRPGRMARQNR